MRARLGRLARATPGKGPRQGVPGGSSAHRSQRGGQFRRLYRQTIVLFAEVKGSRWAHGTRWRVRRALALLALACAAGCSAPATGSARQQGRPRAEHAVGSRDRPGGRRHRPGRARNGRRVRCSGKTYSAAFADQVADPRTGAVYVLVPGPGAAAAQGPFVVERNGLKDGSVRRGPAVRRPGCSASPRATCGSPSSGPPGPARSWSSLTRGRSPWSGRCVSRRRLRPACRWPVWCRVPPGSCGPRPPRPYCGSARRPAPCSAGWACPRGSRSPAWPRTRPGATCTCPPPG